MVPKLNPAFVGTWAWMGVLCGREVGNERLKEGGWILSGERTGKFGGVLVYSCSLSVFLNSHIEG
jgi:hypothetical protein